MSDDWTLSLFKKSLGAMCELWTQREPWVELMFQFHSLKEAARLHFGNELAIRQLAWDAQRIRAALGYCVVDRCNEKMGKGLRTQMCRKHHEEEMQCEKHQDALAKSVDGDVAIDEASVQEYQEWLHGSWDLRNRRLFRS